MLRVYLTGSVHIECATSLLKGGQLPGRQGRRAFVWLCLNRSVPNTRQALAEAIWGESPPGNWDGALSPLLSKLRRLLKPYEINIETNANAHQLQLPADTWIDTEAAVVALEQALVGWRAGQPERAFGHAAAALSITRQPLLPAEAADWLDLARDRLLRCRATALELMTDIWLSNNEPALAVETASELVRLEPFRDSGFQRLMRAHILRGDRARAIRVFLDFQRQIADEMGVDPAAETAAIYLKALEG
jgi:DNA-binding SARP family transcriptional activator